MHTPDIETSAPLRTSHQTLFVEDVKLRAQLIAALARARPSFETVAKTATGQVGPRRYRYAELADVIAAVALPLAAEGVVLMHRTQALEGGRVRLWAELHHGEGGWIASTLDLGCSTKDPQEYGKHYTYARRYLSLGLLGLAPDDDDDAASVSGKGRGPGPGGERRPPPGPPGPERGVSRPGTPPLSSEEQQQPTPQRSLHDQVSDGLAALGIVNSPEDPDARTKAVIRYGGLSEGRARQLLEDETQGFATAELRTALTAIAAEVRRKRDSDGGSGG